MLEDVKLRCLFLIRQEVMERLVAAGPQTPRRWQLTTVSLIFTDRGLTWMLCLMPDVLGLQWGVRYLDFHQRRTQMFMKAEQTPKEKNSYRDARYKGKGREGR